MRDLDLVDAVITLYNVSRLVEEAIGVGKLSEDIRKVADTLHSLSLKDHRISPITQQVINKAKQ